jgi:hypothetical protein
VEASVYRVIHICKYIWGRSCETRDWEGVLFKESIHCQKKRKNAHIFYIFYCETYILQTYQFIQQTDIKVPHESDAEKKQMYK